MTDDQYIPAAMLGRAQRSPSRTLTALAGGILGLLARDGELSGWDIFKHARGSVAFFVPIGRSQIYSALPRLEQRGLIAGRDVEQEQRPRKRVFTLSDAGRAELHDWLAAGDSSPTRDVFLLKVFFGAHTDPSAIRARILQRRSDARLIMAEMDARPDPAQLDFSNLDDFFHRLTREWARGWAELAASWCDQALQALDALDKQIGNENRPRGSSGAASAADHRSRRRGPQDLPPRRDASLKRRGDRGSWGCRRVRRAAPARTPVPIGDSAPLGPAFADLTRRFAKGGRAVESQRAGR